EIHALVEELDQDRLHFIEALEKVSEKAQNVGNMDQEGATGSTLKNDSVALTGDAAEVVQGVTHLGGHLAHEIVGGLGPLIAAGYVFNTYRGIKKAKEHIEHLKKEIAAIDARLQGLPPPAADAGPGHH